MKASVLAMITAYLSITAVSDYFHRDIAVGRLGNTKRIPRSGWTHRTRAHAPNDGRWHMKHHRGRS